MKQLTLTLSLICAACGLAFGGPERMPSGKEIVQVPVAEPTCFGGWYFGVHGGATVSNSDATANAEEASLGARENGFVHASDSSSTDGGASFQGGIHFGYNWLHNTHWLFGFEADISATALDDNTTATASTFLPNNEDRAFTTAVGVRSTVDWYSTVRPRLGYIFGERWMLFLTGGLAFGDAELRSQTAMFALREEDPSIDRSSAFDDDREIKFGWTAGAGFEVCLTHHVSLSFTYLYVDLDDSHAGNDVSFVSDQIPRTFDYRARASSDNAFHVFEGGLNLHF